MRVKEGNWCSEMRKVSESHRELVFRLKRACIPVKELIEALEEKNKVINDLLYNNVQHNLSHLGSQIMDFIINYFTQRGILVLPVFDEVIIEMDHEEKLVKVMEMAYESVLGFTDNCYVVKEK